MGPPVTFTSPAPKSKEAAATGEIKEEAKGGEAAGAEVLNETSFDVVQSPMRRTITSLSDAKATKTTKPAAMVPQEQYDALKARFIESETQFQRRLEGINDLEKTIERRTEQIMQLEKMYQGKLEDAKKELEQFKMTARETEKNIQQEVKLAKEERIKMAADLNVEI